MSEAEIIASRTSLFLAQSHSLIQSWLPPKTAEENSNRKTEEELEAEDQESLTVVPDHLGLGAPIPRDAGDEIMSSGRTAAEERLRKQMIGKELRKLGSQQEKQRQGPHATNVKKDAEGHVPPKARQVSRRPHNIDVDEEEDEEESRSGMHSSKRKTHPTPMPIRHQGSSSDEVKSEPAPKNFGKGGKRRAANYLDEVLSERAQKRNKKKAKS